MNVESKISSDNHSPDSVNALWTEHLRTDSNTTINNTYPQLAIPRLNQALCFYQNICFVDLEVLRFLRMRKAAIHCSSYKTK
jgi:hypothetical protein